MNAEQLRVAVRDGMIAVERSNRRVQVSNMLTAADAGKEALAIMTLQMEFISDAVCMLLYEEGLSNG
jgi:hypothetical protein